MATLQAQTREQMSSAESQRMRKSGFLPMAVVGHGKETRLIKAALTDIRTVLHESRGAAVFGLTLDEAAKPMNVVVKQIQRDPVSRKVTHLTLQEVRSTDKIRISVPVVVTGEPESVKQGECTLMTPMNSVEVHAQVSKLPDEITVDASGLAAREAIHVSDLVAPEGVEFLTPGESVVVATVVLRQTAEAEEEAPAEGAAEGAAEAEAAPTA